MKKAVLLIACIAVSAQMTSAAMAQATSSGSISGRAKTRVTEVARPLPVRQHRAVASNRTTADPETTGSISQKPNN